VSRPTILNADADGLGPLLDAPLTDLVRGAQEAGLILARRARELEAER
jgi:hypothetical protein